MIELSTTALLLDFPAVLIRAYHDTKRAKDAKDADQRSAG